METAFLFASNILFSSSYLVRDMLLLRILTIVAIGLLVPFYAMNTLWEAVAWEMVFLTINVYQTAVLLSERRPVQLGDEERALRDLAFPRLTPHEFRRLLGAAEWKDCQPGDTLLEEGCGFSALMVLFRGRLAVEKSGRPVAELSPGRFVGEMSYITGESTTANVRATEAARCVAWPSDRLEALFVKNPDLRSAVQLILAKDMAGKLARGQARLEPMAN